MDRHRQTGRYESLVSVRFEPLARKDRYKPLAQTDVSPWQVLLPAGHRPTRNWCQCYGAPVPGGAIVTVPVLRVAGSVAPIICRVDLSALLRNIKGAAGRLRLSLCRTSAVQCLDQGMAPDFDRAPPHQDIALAFGQWGYRLRGLGIPYGASEARAEQRSRGEAVPPLEQSACCLGWTDPFPCSTTQRQAGQARRAPSAVGTTVV